MIIPQDLQRLVVGMALLVPLSYLLRYIGPLQKYWYSLVLSSLLQIYVFRKDMYPIYIQHLVVYGLIRLKGPKCGLIVTVESMVFLSAYHLHQIVTNYGGWSMNASALLMILVCKYSLLAYDLQDGAVKDSKEIAQLSQEQLQYGVTGELSFADFIGYCNFLPSALVGPPLEFQDYWRFMNGQEVYSNIPTNALNMTLVRTAGQTVLCGVMFVLGQSHFPVEAMRSEPFYDHGFLYVLFYVLISVTLGRFKYYFGWKLSMCAVHSSGVSYNGADFSRINSVNVVEVETSVHVREKINNWNVQVQKWLGRCIYQRHDFKSKTKNQLFVFLISAFWHGFYAAYYVSFVLWFAQLYLQGLVFTYCKNDNTLARAYRSAGKLGNFVLSFLVQLLFTNNAAFFLILDGPSCVKLSLKLRFAPQIVLVGLIVLFSFVKAPSQPKLKLGQEAPAEAGKKVN